MIKKPVKMFVNLPRIKLRVVTNMEEDEERDHPLERLKQVTVTGERRRAHMLN